MENKNTSDMGNIQALPFYSQQALMFSQGWADKYAGEHVGGKMGFDERTAGSMGCARLEFILGFTRRELTGMFTESEIGLLLNCYQAEVFFPDQFRSFASDLLDDLGLDVKAYHEEAVAPLIDKLRALTPGQRVALADALEQTWYRGLPGGTRVREFLAELGIELAPD